MSSVALIKLTQGLNIGEGIALAGEAGVVVVVENCFNIANAVRSWKIDLVYWPPGSIDPATTHWEDANSASPYAEFTPEEVPGCYRIVLKTYDNVNFSLAGGHDLDIRNFVIKDPATGIVYPPYQGLPAKLPIEGSGLSGQKPDELNLGGQPYGWDGYGNEGLLLDFMRRLGSSSSPNVHDDTLILDWEDTGGVDLGTEVTENTVIKEVKVKVTTPFDGVPIMSVGPTGDEELLAAVSEVDLTQEGTYIAQCFYKCASATQVKAWISGATSQGECMISLSYVPGFAS